LNTDVKADQKIVDHLSSLENVLSVRRLTI